MLFEQQLAEQIDQELQGMGLPPLPVEVKSEMLKHISNPEFLIKYQSEGMTPQTIAQEIISGLKGVGLSKRPEARQMALKQLTDHHFRTQRPSEEAHVENPVMRGSVPPTAENVMPGAKMNLRLNPLDMFPDISRIPGTPSSYLQEV